MHYLEREQKCVLPLFWVSQLKCHELWNSMHTDWLVSCAVEALTMCPLLKLLLAASWADTLIWCRFLCCPNILFYTITKRTEKLPKEFPQADNGAVSRTKGSGQVWNHMGVAQPCEWDCAMFNSIGVHNFSMPKTFLLYTSYLLYFIFNNWLHIKICSFNIFK